MDISSLLSPSDSPLHENLSPPAKPPARRPRRTKSSTQTPSIGASPLSKTTLPPPTLPHNAVAQAQQQAVASSPANSPGSAIRLGATATPPADSLRSSRQPSTSGMDTLADLASMQHHQQTARANSTGLRNVDVYDRQLSPATIVPNLHSLPRTPTKSRNSVDFTMPDAPTQTPIPRTYAATSLSESDLQTITSLASGLAKNPNTFESHVQLVKLLHQGFVSHLRSSSASSTPVEPLTYELLDDLRKARKAMHARFALGEELWIEQIEDEKLLAKTLEESLIVLEMCKEASEEESGSTKIWMLYGDWVQSLYEIAYAEQTNAESTNGTSSDPQRWSPEDLAVAREVFGRQLVIDVWEQAAEDTKWRIDNSHLAWDRWTNIRMQNLDHMRSSEAIEAMKVHFTDRLQIPHSTWDQTFQSFSHFISTYDNAIWEEVMVNTNRLASEGKNKYSLREALELKLERAVDVGDKNAEWTTFTEYFEFEMSQSRKKNAFSSELVDALYRRANLRFPTDTKFWEEYMMFVIDEDDHQKPVASTLSILERATQHCPWSGTLWSHSLLTAERQGQDFVELGKVKHRATSTGLLDAGGMEEVLKVHIAWCGFLRRRAFQKNATDEELDVAEVGIRSAIEDMETLGRQKYGKSYKGDPNFRLERLYIKYLSQSRNLAGARDTWKGLVARHGDSFEFWLKWHTWEMTTWGLLSNTEVPAVGTIPTEATKVLRQATKRTNMDWPEKIVETFLQHCENHESVPEIQSAIVQSQKAMKTIAKRREREAVEAALQQQQSFAGDAVTNGESESNGKRKREPDDNAADEAGAKKFRPDLPDSHGEEQSVSASSVVKRDRENATVVVRNLPIETTEIKVRQYFRDCGTINSLKIIPDDGKETAIATIEFDSKEDVLTAQTKDMKTFDGNSIQVHVSAETILFVTNFPQTADESYIQEMFGAFGEIVDIRLPSLQGNTRRRFCYVQFKTPGQALAATALDGKDLGGKNKLVAKISDPNRKQNRSGPQYDGREIYVSNVDWTATKEDVSQIFSKYGIVESVRIPTNLAGNSKGMAFVVFSSPDEATAACEMNLTKFKSRILYVSLSTPNPAKRQATTTISSISRAASVTSPSPQPDSTHQNGTATTSAASASPPSSSKPITKKPTPQEIRARTVALLNIPDTVNDTRIRALMEPYGPLVKIVLRPDHQGAIVEYADVSSAGKASLAVDGKEIAPGRNLGVGSVSEMLKMKPEKKSSRIGQGGPSGAKGPAKKEQADAPGGSLAFQAPAAVRRPAAPGGIGRRGGKGGLGVKMGLGIGRSSARGKDQSERQGGSAEGDDGEKRAVADTSQAGAQNGNGDDGDTPHRSAEDPGPKKSNADFKAMFLKS